MRRKAKACGICDLLAAVIVVGGGLSSGLGEEGNPVKGKAVEHVEKGLNAVNSESPQRETILDRKVRIEERILGVPDVSPLCDTLKLQRRRVGVGDCELYSETEGTGPALVLIHGGPGGTHHDFHPHFGRATGFANVVYYDQRGCGQSDYAKGKGYTIGQAVDDLDRLRNASSVDRWVLLGWSYGGALAQSYTLKYPERVAGLVLVGAATDGWRLTLQPTRQFDFLSKEERKRIAELQGNRTVPLPQLVYNAHLNGDWKRQGFYRPTNEDLARMARYGWKHDPVFRGSIGQDLARVDFRGLFDGCPIPVLLLEGKYDLTWGADKAEKLSACFPGSRLVMFGSAAHAPFADEPDKFFSTLREFMTDLPERAGEVAKWKEQIAARQAEREKSPEYLLTSASWGRRSAERISAQYSDAWLAQTSDPMALLKLGFALYDAERYRDALAVFQKMGQCRSHAALALVWEGHMLDLLGKRAEAIARYEKASGMPVSGQHSQYGLVLSPDYVAHRIRTPFTRVENREED